MMVRVSEPPVIKVSMSFLSSGSYSSSALAMAVSDSRRRSMSFLARAYCSVTMRRTSSSMSTAVWSE